LADIIILIAAKQLIENGSPLKYSNLTAFEKHLEGALPNHLAEVYLILSKEAFVRKQAVDRFCALVLKGETTPDLCVQTFDGERHDVAVILQELETMSFFVKRRLIIVQNADAFNKDATSKLEAYFAKPSRTSCLVLVASAINRATTFYKNAEKVGVVLDVAEEKQWEREKSVAEWLHKEVTLHGKQLSLAACQQLVKQLGTDQMLLQCELLKLLCYVGERRVIEEHDIAAVCGSVNQDNAWQLGEALFRRDASAALRISKALLTEGVALIALLRQIRSQYQIEYQVCAIMSQGGSAGDVSQEFPYMRGAILERHVQQAQSYGMTRFRKGLILIDETELQAKSSGVDPDFLAEMLIIKLVTV